MKTVLVVDDDEALCFLLSKILQGKYKVHLVSNGMAAFRWISQGNVPDLIISDFNMPLLTGHEFLQELRASAIFRNIPVIILSGDMNPENRQKCAELGLNKFLEKPFKPAELLGVVEEALSQPPAIVGR
jgi:two-component system, chemotaxis family, chemotaxis protein CheY